jgi:hypothetical protein
MGMQTRIPIPLPAERRIHREARSAARREIALKLHLEGKTLAAIGAVLGVSTTRAFQMLRKAKRLISENEKGAPSQERPLDSIGPLAAGRNHEQPNGIASRRSDARQQ